MEQNKNTITEQDIFVGATVIRADGLKGKIVEICDCSECKARGWCEPVVRYENGEKDWITIMEYKNGFASYYFIGHTILGNRVATEQIEEQISALAIERNKLNAQIDQLRKQVWRLNNTMDGRPMAEIMAEQKARKGKKDGGNNDNA